jgi:molecular chaperone DnaK (HSP70)
MLIDVIAQPLGVAVVGGGMEVVLKKDSVVPAEVTQFFGTAQPGDVHATVQVCGCHHNATFVVTLVAPHTYTHTHTKSHCQVYEGDSLFVSENDALGSFTVRGNLSRTGWFGTISVCLCVCLK